jgi:hypothetical protein
MEIAAMTTERSSYTDVFRQWVETSEQLNDRLDELRPINMQIDDGNHDPTVLAANSRLLCRSTTGTTIPLFWRRTAAFRMRSAGYTSDVTS